MSRYHRMFERCRDEGCGAFIPFVVLGDPDLETCFDICRTLIDAGADALEVGIPFSDPVADGPTIQAADLRALSKGVTPADCFALMKRVRTLNDLVPIGILTYANLSIQNGLDNFYADVKNAGADSVLLADVSSLEGAPFAESALRQGVEPVFIAPPNANADQLDRIASLTCGYTYVVTRSGVTGSRNQLQLNHRTLLAELAQRGAAPPVMGFGISSPEAVRTALASGAAGAISGSAVVGLIQEFADRPAVMHQKLHDFIVALKAATKLDH